MLRLLLGSFRDLFRSQASLEAEIVALAASVKWWVDGTQSQARFSPSGFIA
jgi:hypothetical protein